VAENEARILATPADKLCAELLNEFIGSWVVDFQKVQPQINALSYQWSPEAMIQLSEGYAEGMTAFLDASSQLTGETDRSNTYTVLLLAWPEIKLMQAAQPRKTLTHLHEWLQPFMRLGIMPNLDIEQLRDVCAPPSQAGIGLVMRPLQSRPSSA